MAKNPWFKLAAVSLAGIVISFAVLWGIQQFSSYRYYNGYQAQGYMNTQNGYYNGYYNANGNGMNMQDGMGSGMNVQGGMKMQSNMNGGMNMQAGMNMQGNMNSSSRSGMGMMGMMDGM